EIAGVCKRLETKYGPKTINQRKEKRRVQSQPIKLPNVFPEADEENGERAGVNGLNVSIGDIEAEDIELGERKEQLAADVDDIIAEVDEEALDTDSENEEENEMLVDEEIEGNADPLYHLQSDSDS
ncbi:11600_t:CDS:2, partial [Acaulospora colombiana]